jgi:hypothetical protein
VTTLLPVIERLRTRFGISRTCIVAGSRDDQCRHQSPSSRRRAIDYVLGVGERSTAEVRTTVIDDDGVAVPLTIPRQKARPTLPSTTSFWPGVVMC